MPCAICMYTYVHTYNIYVLTDIRTYVAYQFAYLKIEDVLLPCMQAVKLPPITIRNYLHYYTAVCYYE